MLMVNQLAGFGAGGGMNSTAQFIGGNNGSGAISWPAGTQAGDLAVLTGAGNSGMICSGFSQLGDQSINGTSYARSMWRVLDASAVSNPPTPGTPSSGHWGLMVFRGPTQATKKVGQSSGSVSAQSKAATSKFFIATSVNIQAGVPSVVSGWTSGGAQTSTFFAERRSYILSDDYNGGAFTVPSNGTTAVQVFELSAP